jgi:hypothetical protein
MLVAVAQVDQDQHGLRTSDMLKIANARDQSYAADDVEMLREGIEMFCEASIDRVNTRRLGVRLSHFRNRVVDKMAFDYTLKGGVNYWFVQSHGGSGVSGVSHSANLNAQEKTGVQVSLNEIGVALSGENTSTTSTKTDVTPDLDWVEGLFQ